MKTEKGSPRSLHLLKGRDSQGRPPSPHLCGSSRPPASARERLWSQVGLPGLQAEGHLVWLPLGPVLESLEDTVIALNDPVLLDGSLLHL